MLAMNLWASTGMRKKICAICLCGIALFATSAHADADPERGALAQLVHEIDALTPLIQAAEAPAEQDARIRFQYAWLRQDLARVRQGISEHLNAPQSEPRRFPPLRGDYRQ